MKARRVTERELRDEIDRLSRKAPAPVQQTEACEACEQPKWMHILPARLRGDGHAFRPKASGQMRLPFDVAQFPGNAKPAAAIERQSKPPQRAVAPAAKKPAKRAAS